MCAHSSEPIHTHQQQQKNPNSNRRVLTSSGMRSVSRRDCGSHFDIYTSTHAVLLYTFSYVQCYLAINPGPGEEAYKVCCIFPYFIPRFLSSDLSYPLQPLPLLQSWSLPPPWVTLRLPCSFLSTYNILWAQLLCLSLGSLPGPSGLSAALKAAWASTHRVTIVRLVLSLSNHIVLSEGRTYGVIHFSRAISNYLLCE